VAESLSKHKGWLNLNGLTTLSDAAAESLSRHEGCLSLLGLTALSDAAAESLSKHDGFLGLDGLVTLSDAAAESLSKHDGDLHLDGLATLSDAAAESLSKHERELHIHGLTTLSDAAAESLSKYKQKNLSLPGLETLSDAAAESLSKYKGNLSLNSLETLSDAAAESLSKHTGDLNLDGLTTLSDAAAESLSKHDGLLSLDGLETLSDAAAESLSEHVGSLSLHGLRELSDAAVVSLSAKRDSVLVNEKYIELPNDSEDEEEDWDEDEDEVEDEADEAGSAESEFAAVHYIRLSIAQLTDPLGTVINSLGMKLVPIAPGEFMMGGRENEEGYDPKEEQLHRVRITRPFLIGMFQVTQSEYASVVGQNPSEFHGKNRPVEHVSWREAADFCRRLSELPTEKASGRSYRLPTEAEWEYACRAGTETAFTFGDEITTLQAIFCSDCVTRPQPTCPVGMFPPNAWGLFDMHGNVWEWCQDWYSLKYYGKSPGDDPPGPSKGKHHVLRGGSASVLAHECRSAVRGEADSDGPNAEGEQRFEIIGDFGLRVVCEFRAGRV